MSSCLVGNMEVGRLLWHPQPWCLVVAASCMPCETVMQPGTENKSIFQLRGAHPTWPWRNTRFLCFHGAWPRGALMCARAILMRPLSFGSPRKKESSSRIRVYLPPCTLPISPFVNQSYKSSFCISVENSLRV
jgi:hypothetical protein